MDESKIKYVQDEQKRIHALVTEKTDKYYLTGGTALAFHCDHRYSEDLDYFSQNYSKNDCSNIMKHISEETGYKYELVYEQENKQFLPVRMYELQLKNDLILKIDFVQDPFKNVSEVKDGVHSIEDIYCRKLYITLNPTQGSINEIGKNVSGGRQVAKDLFDLYYLSKNVEPLQDFYLKHFPESSIERIESWYRSIDRLDMKIELNETINMHSPDKVFKHLDNQIIHGLSHEGGIDL